MLPKLLAIALVLAAPVRGATAQFQFEVLHSFSAAGPGGRTPAAPLLQAADGSLYGTTVDSSPVAGGVVYQILANGSVVTRALADYTTGRSPYGGLIQLADGTLYGTTFGGGANSSGTFFAISPSGTFATYSLPKVTNISGELRPANGPMHAPVLATDGNLYAGVQGWATISTNYYPGAIVRLTPEGVVSRVGGPHTPAGPLVAGPDGYLYGTDASTITRTRSAYRFLPPSGPLQTIHFFTTAEASGPTGLVLAPDENFYGASGTSFGGANGDSTAFRMTPSGDVTVLHQFQAATEGTEPRAPLVVGGDGNLYGVTSRGGAFDKGTIFRISLAGTFDVIYTFTGGDDGGQPVAALIQGSDGGLYGTASIGGSGGGGVVFRIRSTATEPILTIDVPGAGATVGRTFVVAGWAIDRQALVGTGIDAIHVYAFPNPGSGAAPIFLNVAALGTPRPDVGALLGSRFTPSGYGLVSPALAPGPYLLAALGRSTVTGTFSAVATRAVTVVAPESRPFMSLDVPAPGATVTGQVVVAGWALDFGAPDDIGVSVIHVWAVPDNGSPAIFLGVATYGISRPDLGALFGSRFTGCGYQLVAPLPAGRYTIAAFARSTVAFAFNNMRIAANVTVQ